MISRKVAKQEKLRKATSQLIAKLILKFEHFRPRCQIFSLVSPNCWNQTYEMKIYRRLEEQFFSV